MRSLKINSRFGEYKVSFFEIKMMQSLLKDRIIIIDKTVFNIYKKYFIDFNPIIFNCNEDNKTLNGSIQIINELVKRKVKTNSKISVVGGGILQDVAGFACSIYGRGIEYDLLPTTLLSQCDSCIGGKTSINHNHIKNILGTFYPPKNIYICTDFLDSLKKEDYLSGFGEIIKFFILQEKEKYLNKNLKIEKLIYKSLMYKISIIEKDEFDKFERKFLNYGHTFGHAIEITSKHKIPHGSAVLIGILVANNVSYMMNLLKEKRKKEIEKIVMPYLKHLKIKKSWFNFEDLIELIKLDKKNTGSINMILKTDDCNKIIKIDNLEILKKSVYCVYESIRLYN